MEQRGDGVARSFYLAQLQACKGSCKCNVCQLLRKSTDEMTESLLNPPSAVQVSVETKVQELMKLGYEIKAPDQVEERR